LELLVVIIIILVLFGGSRLPEIGKGLGKTINNFKRGMSRPKETDIKAKEDREKRD